MPIALVIIGVPRQPASRRELSVTAGTSILKAAHARRVDITATCGGRGRCTSCRVKFIAGAIPPPTIMDEVQLGHDLVREGYRLSCQCAVVEPLTVQVAPPVDEHAFQILGPGAGPPAGVPIEAGVVKRLVRVALPREEHHQTSDLEQLALATGVDPTQVGTGLLAGLPDALRGSPDGATVTTFGAGADRRLIAVE